MLTHKVVFVIAVSFVCISLATGTLVFFSTFLPTGPSGERSPFQFLECAVRGGDAGRIEGADTANALFLGQYPFVDGRDPNVVYSMSWPKYMEAQDLYPVAASTYTWATGTKIEVPCSARDEMVKIERTECPDPFVNPIDPNHGSPCVKVLHWTKHDTWRLIYILLPSFVRAVLPSSGVCYRRLYRDVGCKPCCWIDWVAVKCVHDRDLVILLWTFSRICLLFRCIVILSFHVCLPVSCCNRRYLGGIKVFIAVVYQVKACVFAALLYAIVETIPSLVLKYDLPCSECTTEEW
jgi:hypothetical protein